MSTEVATRSWAQFVPGDPAPKGSNLQWIDNEGRRRYRSDSKRLRDWAKAISEVAVYTRPRAGPLAGPVAVGVTFFLRRPKTVKREWPTGRGDGDLDKLFRALDALVGPVLVDDSQIVKIRAMKCYAKGETGMSILVEELTEAEQEALLGG